MQADEKKIVLEMETIFKDLGKEVWQKNRFEDEIINLNKQNAALRQELDQLRGEAKQPEKEV